MIVLEPDISLVDETPSMQADVERVEKWEEMKDAQNDKGGKEEKNRGGKLPLEVNVHSCAASCRRNAGVLEGCHRRPFECLASRPAALAQITGYGSACRLA